MSKRKPALPKRWPGHSFDRAEIESLIDRLRRDQDPNSAAFIGERFAFALLDKSPAEMKAATNARAQQPASWKATPNLLLLLEGAVRLRLWEKVSHFCGICARQAIE